MKICPSMKRAIKSTAASCWLFYGNLEHNVKKKSDRFKKGVVTYIYDYIYESEPYGAPMASRQVPLWSGIWSHCGNL